MNINSVNSVYFGKTPVMHCYAKKSGEKTKENATLFVMNNRNTRDLLEVKESEGTSAIKADFLRNAGRTNCKKYYMLKSDKTGEVISCASSSRHITPEGEYFEGLNTVVDEMGLNHKYVDPITPLLAQIAKEAYEQNNQRIIVAMHKDEIPSLRHSCFSETKDDGWVLPQKRFHVLIDKAEKRHGAEFIV